MHLIFVPTQHIIVTSWCDVVLQLIVGPTLTYNCIFSDAKNLPSRDPSPLFALSSHIQKVSLILLPVLGLGTFIIFR